MSDIRPLCNRPGYFLVPSRDGKRLHEVESRTLACDCPDFRFRREGTRERCCHGLALQAYLEAQAACPACGGRGRFLLRTIVVNGEPATIECATCSGSGSRSTADPALLAAEDRYRAE